MCLKLFPCSACSELLKIFTAHWKFTSLENHKHLSNLTTTILTVSTVTSLLVFSCYSSTQSSIIWRKKNKKKPMNKCYYKFKYCSSNIQNVQQCIQLMSFNPFPAVQISGFSCVNCSSSWQLTLIDILFWNVKITHMVYSWHSQSRLFIAGVFSCAALKLTCQRLITVQFIGSVTSLPGIQFTTY